MAKFSANLGFLWQELPLPEAIRAAKKAGFDAVECHWPYSFDIEDIKAALRETGLPLLGLNTIRGNIEAGDNGLTAVAGRESEARAAIDLAITYASELKAPNIHVMAGRTQGTEAYRTYLSNLTYACERASIYGITILIEPLNERDAPGYFLRTSEQSLSIIEKLGHDNLKLMFDCYHIQIMEGDICKRLEVLIPHIGHVQIASVPDRAEPDHGELNYRYIVSWLNQLGYRQPIGVEYRPATSTADGLAWMQLFR